MGHWKMLWKAIARKIRMRVRLLLVRCFNILPNSLLQQRQFGNLMVNMNFFTGFGDREETKKVLQNNDKLKSQILVQSEKIINHRFNLLGSTEVDLGTKIDWHCDFKSSYRWPLKYYHLIELDMFSKELSQDEKKDIKIPWELSRFQHLIVLGQAYWLTGNEIYTHEFKNEIISWIEENPPEMGVNWVCSMDISLRVVSLIFAYFLFRCSPEIEKAFWDQYFTLLYNSGLHIEQNPEVCFRGHGGHGNNHYLTNCAAMVWLGIFFKGYDRRTRIWLKNGLDNLVKEMDYQVNPDGGSFEGSISYHRYVVELFLCTTILAKKNKINFPKAYENRLEKMCEFSMHYSKPNGLAPQFGDADNGRFCILSGYGWDDIRDHRSILGIAGQYFEREDFLIAAADKWWDCFWLLGRPVPPGKAALTYPELASYPDTGYYIIRKEKIFLMIKCGSIGQKNLGGHDHNDQLSFELNIDGEDFIIDPGSFVYSMDKDMRHLFRSAKYHNVSQVGRLEQNVIKNANIEDLFSMYSSNPGICTHFAKTTVQSIRFSGQFVLAGTEILYTRSLELNHSQKCIDIVDDFIGTEEKATCRLHLAKDLTVKHLTEKTVEVSRNNISVRIEAEEPIGIELGMVSPGYGVKYDSLILSWNFRSKTNFKIYYDAPGRPFNIRWEDDFIKRCKKRMPC